MKQWKRQTNRNEAIKIPRQTNAKEYTKYKCENKRIHKQTKCIHTRYTKQKKITTNENSNKQTK